MVLVLLGRSRNEVVTSRREVGAGFEEDELSAGNSHAGNLGVRAGEQHAANEDKCDEKTFHFRESLRAQAPSAGGVEEGRYGDHWRPEVGNPLGEPKKR